MVSINSSLLNWQPDSSQTLTLLSHLATWVMKKQSHCQVMNSGPYHLRCNALPLSHKLQHHISKADPRFLKTKQVLRQIPTLYLLVSINGSLLYWEPICSQPLTLSFLLAPLMMRKEMHIWGLNSQPHYSKFNTLPLSHGPFQFHLQNKQLKPFHHLPFAYFEP